MFRQDTSKQRFLRACIAVVAASGGLFYAADEAEPWIGVWLGDSVDGGALVVALVPDGPAERGGVRAGDIVVEANGLPVPDQDRLGELLSGLTPGEPVRLSVLRGGRTVAVSVILEKRSPERSRVAVRAPRRVAEASEKARHRLESRLRVRPTGLQVEEITPALRRHFGAPPDSGVLVVRVDSGWLGEAVDLRVGDVLVRMGDREISERRQLERTLRTWNWDRPLQAQLIRAGEPRVIELPRPASAPDPRGNEAADDSELLERSLRLEIERLQRRIEALQAELERIREKR